MKFLKRLVKVFLLGAAGISGSFAAVLIMILVLVALGAGMAASQVPDSGQPQLEYFYGDPLSEHRLASLPINGLILGSRDETTGFFELFSEFGLVYGYEVKQKLLSLADNDAIQGVILEINSPGGTIYGTQAIVDGIDYYRQETDKPIIVHIGSVAASGGYWVAAAGDRVYADAGTAIGSIGIISGPFKYYDDVVAESGGAFLGGVDTRGGIETEFITAGFSKDLGNPYRRMTDQERQVLQRNVDGAYNSFVTLVADQRGLQESYVRDRVGALIFTDIVATELGLIDGSSSRESAYHSLADMTGADEPDFQILRDRGVQTFFDTLVANLQRSSLGLLAIGGYNPPSACPFDALALAYYGNVGSLCP